MRPQSISSATSYAAVAAAASLTAVAVLLRHRQLLLRPLSAWLAPTLLGSVSDSSGKEDLLTLGVREQAKACRQAARALQLLSHAERVAVLHAMADALEANSAEICAANELDVAAAATAKMSGALAARLPLTPKKLSGVATGIRSLAAQPDPIGRVKRHVELAPGLTLTQV